jgi:hypothetical protein
MPLPLRHYADAAISFRHYFHWLFCLLLPFR